MVEPQNRLFCLSPNPPSKPKKLVLPAQAWDCHVHVIGEPPAHPYVEPKLYTPYAVTPVQFVEVLDSVGMRYGVAVQTSVHGTNNDYLLEALRQFPDRLTGVAVIDAATPDKDMAELQQAGVVGIRLLEGAGAVGTDDMERLADRCAEIGWHIQVCVVGHRFPELLPRLRKLRVPLVIDHMGWFPVAETPAGQSFQAVLELLRDTDSWIKISGAFRLSAQMSPYLDTLPFLKELIAVAPERAVWGSDWPHVGITERQRMPFYGELLDLLALASSDQAVIRKILVDNPRELYGSKRS